MSNEAKKLVEEWFESVGEECHSKSVHHLFDGVLLPMFSGKVDEPILSRPPYKTRDTDPEYFDKIDAYNEESSKLRAERRTLLAESGYEHIECHGGQDEGEYCYGVIKIGDKYLKAEWSYYSYDGCEYNYIKDTIKFVTPTTKTITVYE